MEIDLDHLHEMDQHDDKRITEDGAEAVALALAYQARGFTVLRRMMQGEHSDWQLECGEGPNRQIVALEVSGTDHGSVPSRMTEKLAQVAKSIDVDQRWACVVGFARPQAALHSVERVPG
ncbi:MAG: hypothetical protein GXP62_05485 [Oligoflexia bacterium]|nr:hypothetical protein [Oligoflexia bacterium]